MITGNIFAILILTYFTKYVIEMITNKKRRDGAVKVNEKLDELRKIPVKTLEQQLEFINLKKPKLIGRRFTWRSVFSIILHIIIFIIIFRGYYYIFELFYINLVLWQGILFLILFPILANILLAKFNIQKGDLSVFFRRKTK